MAYECTECGHPDYAHGPHYCRLCIEQLASHEFTLEKKEQSTPHLHGKLAEQKTVAHDWETSGFKQCSPSCEACRILRVRAAEQREKIKQPPHAAVLTDDDRKFLAAQKILW